MLTPEKAKQICRMIVENRVGLGWPYEQLAFHLLKDLQTKVTWIDKEEAMAEALSFAISLSSRSYDDQRDMILSHDAILRADEQRLTLEGEEVSTLRGLVHESLSVLTDKDFVANDTEKDYIDDLIKRIRTADILISKAEEAAALAVVQSEHTPGNEKEAREYVESLGLRLDGGDTVEAVENEVSEDDIYHVVEACDYYSARYNDPRASDVVRRLVARFRK